MIRTVNIEVERNAAESTASLIRRFSKQVQGAGILRRVRGGRFYNRPPSKLLKKKRTLKMIKRRAVYQELLKLGKTPPQKKGRGRRRS